MGRTASTEPQCLYKGALYLFYLYLVIELYRPTQNAWRKVFALFGVIFVCPLKLYSWCGWIMFCLEQMLYLYYCDSGRKHMFCENDTHGRKLWHVEFLRDQPLGTNNSLLLGNVQNVSKLPYILSVLQHWKTRDIKTGWWQGKSRDLFVNSSAWRQKPTREENQHCCYCCDYDTGRFIMFSVITNIYNKKTKWPALMELFKATGKLKKFFFTTRDVRCVHHGWHGTPRYDIQVLAIHASTWVHRYSSLL